MTCIYCEAATATHRAVWGQGVLVTMTCTDCASVPTAEGATLFSVEDGSEYVPAETAIADTVADSMSGPTYSTRRDVLIVGGISTEGNPFAIRLPFKRFERTSRAMFVQLARGLQTGPVTLTLDYTRESDR